MGVAVGTSQGARRQAFLLALRLAWRDMGKHKGRSALIVGLIALPVAGMTAIVLLLTSSQMTPQEKIATELGTAQAVLMPGMGSGYVQMPADPRSGFQVSEPDPEFIAKTPLEAAPPGYELIEEETGHVELFKGKVPIYAQFRTTELFNPAFDSRFEMTEGSQSSDPHAVYLSEPLAERLLLGVGDQLKVGSESYPITGILREGGLSAATESAFAAPGHPLMGKSQSTQSNVYLLGSEPLTWSEIKELNTVGVSALSRAVLLDPPGAAELPAGATDNQRQAFLMGVLAISVIGSLVLAEVGLLAGAAFAVGAKGQRRMLALIAAAGGEKSTVRFIVTASGVVLGGVGVIIGAAGGIGIAAVLVFWHLAKASPLFPGFHFVWWPIAVFAGLGFLASVIAALLPGSAVAKQNVFAAVKTAHGASKPARRIPIVGFIAFGAAIVLGGAGIWLAYAAGHGEEFSARAIIFVPLLALGSVLFLVGLLACTGRIVDLFARAAARAPISLRMAARDASRNRSRSVPTAAAVLAATSVAAIVMTASATIAHDATVGQPQTLRELQGSVSLASYDEGGTVSSMDPKLAAAAVEKALPGSKNPTVLSGVLEACMPEQECTTRGLVLPPANSCAERIAAATASPATCRDPQAFGGGLPQFIVDDREGVEAVLGQRPSPDIVDALNEGKLVVLNEAWVEDEHVTIRQETWDPATGQPSGIEELRVEAVVAHNAPDLAIGAIMSPATAKNLDLPVMDMHMVIDLPTQPTTSQADEIRAELIETMGYQATFITKVPGPATEQLLWVTSGIAALVALTAAAVSTGLALADGRSDHITLAGVGAAPSLRKRLAAAQTALGAGLGVVLGMMGGLIPALAVLTAMQRFELIVPWTQLAGLVVIVPLIGAGAAWIFTRASVPMTRRTLLQ